MRSWHSETTDAAALVLDLWQQKQLIWHWKAAGAAALVVSCFYCRGRQRYYCFEPNSRKRSTGYVATNYCKEFTVIYDQPTRRLIVNATLCSQIQQQDYSAAKRDMPHTALQYLILDTMAGVPWYRWLFPQLQQTLCLSSLCWRLVEDQNQPNASHGAKGGLWPWSRRWWLQWLMTGVVFMAGPATALVSFGWIISKCDPIPVLCGN